MKPPETSPKAHNMQIFQILLNTQRLRPPGKLELKFIAYREEGAVDILFVTPADMEMFSSSTYLPSGQQFNEQ